MPHRPHRAPITAAHVLGLLCLLLSLVIPARSDADFESVRIRFDYNDMSGRYGDPAEKYWHESVFHPHYDGRFTTQELEYEDQRTNLSLLMQSYLYSMADLGAETWIIHGTLLGWYWNRQIMPWDSDIDVQMSASTVHFLACYYNMTIHTYQDHEYMLEINPGYVNSSPKDRLNVIDGRWIDIETGLFIDITATRPKRGARGVFATKDRHEENKHDLFPLRDSLFEGQPVKIPYDYASILTREYGNKALTRAKWSGHRFNLTTMEWTKIPKPPVTLSAKEEPD